MRPYKESNVQLLIYNDPDTRLRFCRIFLNTVNIRDIILSNESTFMLMGKFINCVTGTQKIEDFIVDIVHNIVRYALEFLTASLGLMCSHRT